MTGIRKINLGFYIALKLETKLSQDPAEGKLGIYSNCQWEFFKSNC